MIVRFVGTGTILHDGGRGPAGFVVEHDGRCLAVDGGSGTLARLRAQGVSADSLDAAVYTHRHVDHIGDLPSLLFYFKSSGRVRPFPLFGGEGLAGHVHLLRGAHGDLAARFGAPVTELPLDGAGLVEPLPGLHLRTRPAAHKHGALHLGFEAAGRRVVFSGDTGPSAGLVELARGADLLVCECALAAPGEGHLCPDDVAAIVASARPAAVVLHHLYPDVDPEFALDRVAATGVPTHLAHDGLMWADGAWSPAEAHSSASRRRV